jgi:hypothetical protein
MAHDSHRAANPPSIVAALESLGESLGLCVACWRAPGDYLCFGTPWLLCDTCAMHVPYGGTLGARLRAVRHGM